MTAEELNRKYAEAGWLIARRSAAAAGKALLFTGESLEDTMREIAAIYGLSDEEVTRLHPRDSGGGMVAGAQKLAQDLFGSGTAVTSGHAVTVARTAIRNGRAATVLSTLVKAGPRAAQTAAAGGTVVSKGLPWSWIATAGYAVGSAGWFAYNARAMNLEAFELVREREGIVLPDPAEGSADAAKGGYRSAADAITARASALTEKAGAAVTNVVGKFRRP